MVKSELKNETIEDVYQKNCDREWRNTPDGIKIESSFQRGDEETGIWKGDMQKAYIDSLQKSYPTGLITLVKDHKSDTAYQNPWEVLDGGNRIRAIRDYKDDKFVDLNGNKYSQLSEREKARFDNIFLNVQKIIVQRNDSDTTICDMFIRLNTKQNKLEQGELLKAHGHRGDVWILEMSKKIVGDCWTSNFNDVKVPITLYNKDIKVNLSMIRYKWEKVFGRISETNRCDNLAIMTAYIVSALKNNFTLFEKLYKKLHPHLSSSESPSQDQLQKIYTKLWQFLDVLINIKDVSILGRRKNGVPARKKISPIWKNICQGNFNESNKNKMISFYNSLDDNITLKSQYLKLFDSTNGETGNAKIQGIINFILSDH